MITRRAFLGAAGGSVAALGVGTAAGCTTAPVEASTTTPALASVAATGDQQAGVARPGIPQPFTLLSALAWHGQPSPEAVAALLERLGTFATAATTAGPSAALPDGPGDLTITVGIGPRLVQLFGTHLPGAEELPAFRASDTITDRGGDVVVLASAGDLNAPAATTDTLLAAEPDLAVTWQQFGARTNTPDGISRNLLQFLDGIIVPRTPTELDENVWIGDGPLRGATIGVVRRFRLDTARFQRLDIATQEQVIGRHKIDGTPLSGGSLFTPVDINVKNPDGSYITPLRSHARVANPVISGSKLMLRRGYSYLNGTGEKPDEGILFICFQQNLSTFAVTQQQLDAGDDLMEFATPTAEATFLVLPGFTNDQPLGHSLRSA